MMLIGMNLAGFQQNRAVYFSDKITGFSCLARSYWQFVVNLSQHVVSTLQNGTWYSLKSCVEGLNNQQFFSTVFFLTLNYKNIIISSSNLMLFLPCEKIFYVLSNFICCCYLFGWQIIMVCSNQVFCSINFITDKLQWFFGLVDFGSSEQYDRIEKDNAIKFNHIGFNRWPLNLISKGMLLWDSRGGIWIIASIAG